jgi:DNA-binding MarR family transcriptional regulator
VERHEDPEDRRVVRLRLTEHGAQTLQRLATAHFEEIQRLAPRIHDIGQGLEP